MILKTWLIFRDGEHKFARFFKEGFGHIDILHKDDYNWVLINPANRFFIVDILPFKASTDVPEKLRRIGKTTILEIDFDPEISQLLLPRFCPGFTCVSIAKYYFGIRCFAFTPYQLYKKIKANKHIKGSILTGVKSWEKISYQDRHQREELVKNKRHCKRKNRQS